MHYFNGSLCTLKSNNITRNVFKKLKGHLRASKILKREGIALWDTKLFNLNDFSLFYGVDKFSPGVL